MLVEPFMFVVTVDGVLRLAARRSEHVALTDGRDVLPAGEMAFAPVESGWRVTEVPTIGFDTIPRDTTLRLTRPVTPRTWYRSSDRARCAGPRAGRGTPGSGRSGCRAAG